MIRQYNVNVIRFLPTGELIYDRRDGMYEYDYEWWTWSEKPLEPNTPYKSVDESEVPPAVMMAYMLLR